jgi:hypothetical protein
MKKMTSAIALALVVSAAACSRSNSKPADSALNTDLSLAAQQRGYQPLDSISAAERAKANALTTTPAPVAPVTRTAAAPVHHTVHRSSTGSSSGSTSSGTVTSSSSGETVVKHTQLDATIGAGAGAVIGAISSKNKVKGGLIGAAVGGILGGVLGNNVDKTKKKP